jgi:copper chaperone CopZ
MGIALSLISIPAFVYLGLTALAGLPVPEPLDFALNPGRFVFVETLLFCFAFFPLAGKLRRRLARRASAAGTAARPRMRKVITIEGMACGHCAMKVESELRDVPGVASVQVDILTGRARVSGDGLSDAELAAAVAKAGYRTTDIIGSR